MKTFAILAIVGIAATAFFAISNGPSNEAEAEFRNFLETYRVGYGTTEEYNYRLGVFAQNLERAEELNRLNPDATFGVTQFSDRTPEEMEQRMGLIIPSSRKFTGAYKAPRDAKSVDWSNMWKSVKDQGSCGSCWAFSATAAFESRYALHKGDKKVDSLYAEQELVDCDTQSHGCNGGWMDFAFEYLQSHYFCTEDSYPYKAVDQTCSYSEDKCSGPEDDSYTDITEGDEDALLKELQNGPVSVAVDASAWSSYTGGVLENCGTRLNHGVTLVAHNPSAGWAKIRNSWGNSWGEGGHIRIKTGQNTCGYANVASYPTF